jgi:hypothetical protein
LKSAGEIERAFNVYVRPRLGKRSIYDLGRRDIVEMLDAIEDGNGPVMCDRVLAYLVYDRFAYREEKLDALERLAELVERILHSRDSVIRSNRSTVRAHRTPTGYKRYADS